MIELSGLRETIAGLDAAIAELSLHRDRLLAVLDDLAPREAAPPKQIEGPKPEPEQEPKPQPEPAASAAPRPAKRRGARTVRGWWPEHDARAIEMKRAGKTHAEIAQALDRTTKAVSVRFAKHLNARMAEGEAPAPKPSYEPREPAPPTAGAKPGPVIINAPTEKAVLPKLRRPAPRREPSFGDWTVEEDLEMVEILASGGGVAGVVEALGRDRTDVIERWKALLPEVSPEAQTKLINRLREQVAASRTAAE